MFNFFRKKQPPLLPKVLGLTETDYTFLAGVCRALQFKYPNLIHQFEPGFMVQKNETPGGRKGSYTFGTNQDLYDKYCHKDKGYFTVKNIWSRNRSSGNKVEVEVRLSEDILIGYYCEVDIAELDLRSIDASNAYERHVVNMDREAIMDRFKDFPKNALKTLDLGITFRIDLREGAFYTIKDLEDGNYLAINDNGAVFGLIHDPYEIEQIYPDLSSFVSNLNSGNFSIDEYLKKKLS